MQSCGFSGAFRSSGESEIRLESPSSNAAFAKAMVRYFTSEKSRKVHTSLAEKCRFSRFNRYIVCSAVLKRSQVIEKTVGGKNSPVFKSQPPRHHFVS